MAISPINLGNTFTNLNGQNVLSGLSSGLNAQSLIDSIVKAQSSQITPLKDKIEVNNSEISALSELKTLLSNLQAAAAKLSNPYSPDASNNLFASNGSTITSNTTQPASNFITASVTSTATAGTYNITNISTVAKQHVQETGAFVIANADTSVVEASATANRFTAGSITVNGQAITLVAGDTLNQVAQKFNNANTGITASVVLVSTGNYKLVFNSNNTGTGQYFDLSNDTSNPVTSQFSITGSTAVFDEIAFTIKQTASNAQFKLNGVDISRSSNTISDLISGVTLNIIQDTTAAAGANISLNIAPDVHKIKDGVVNLATAYNAFLLFNAKQTELSSQGTPTSSAILYSNTTLRTLFSQLSAQASSIVAGISGGNPDKLSDLGINFIDFPGDKDNTPTKGLMNVDETELVSKLQSNISGVKNALGYKLTSSDSNLILFKSANLQSITSFTVDINQTTDTYTATYTDASGAHTVNLAYEELSTGGVSLTGPAGSALAGLKLIYGSTGNASGITVTTSQGIADKLRVVAEPALVPVTGLVDSDIDSIKTRNTTIDTDISDIEAQINTTRATLLQRFSALEAAVAKANSVLNLLNAQQQAGNQ